MDRVYKEERNYILGMVKKIKASGCNVLLIQKSILRDAVTDLSLHYLVSNNASFASAWLCGCCSCAAVRGRDAVSFAPALF
jgi:chaperonin GroEL (HSP60 family)